MAVDQLTVYNNALYLLGQRKLDSLTEDRAPRYVLDEFYSLEAVDYCLELVQPLFAAKTVTITPPGTIPTDYIATMGVYSDADLTDPVDHFSITGRTLSSETSPVYLRYTANDSTLSDWSPGFAQVVAAYLACQSAVKIAPDKAAASCQRFTEQVQVTRSLEREKDSLLDGANDSHAVEYCLELILPHFARVTVNLATSAANTGHDLDNTFDLPSDYVAVVGVFSDPELSDEIGRYIIDGTTLACDYESIYLRYITNAKTQAQWSSSFRQAADTYTELQKAIQDNPEAVATLQELFDSRVKTAISIDARNHDAETRPPQTTQTLTDDWRGVYNDALLILGLRAITTNTEDSNRRSVLDTVRDSKVVEDMLEETGWIFALSSDKLTYDSTVAPDWGYTRVHAKPRDMHRLHGLYQDEHMREPLRYYHDEGGYIYSGLNIVYIQYVHKDFLCEPCQWPAFFSRLVAAKLAYDAAPSLKKEGADVQNAMLQFQERRREALSNDAISAPPKIFSRGSWMGQRWRGGYRGRP